MVRDGLIGKERHHGHLWPDDKHLSEDARHGRCYRTDYAGLYGMA